MCETRSGKFYAVNFLDIILKSSRKSYRVTRVHLRFHKTPGEHTEKMKDLVCLTIKFGVRFFNLYSQEIVIKQCNGISFSIIFVWNANCRPASLLFLLLFEKKNRKDVR